MKQLTKVLMLAGVIAAFGLSAVQVSAQGRGNFDPAQFRQRMMDRYKEQMEVKDDAEWKAIEGKINKVMDAQRDAMVSRFGGFTGGRGGSRGGNSDTNSSTSSDSSSRRNRGGFGGEPNVEMEALRKAIESKASEADIAAKLEKVRAANKAKEAKLENAQEDLKKLLTPKQEAIAVAGGLLK